MTQRRVFYSFHYEQDNQVAAQVRNIGMVEGNRIGMVEGNRPAQDNDWETVKRGGDAAIKKWIADQMKGRTCTVVLVGTGTAGRKWINHEIKKSWDDEMGVVGIYIHRLRNLDGKTSTKGDNPFESINYGNNGEKLSSIVKCYNPEGSDSKERYDWIKEHLANAVEEAIKTRKDN